MLFYYIYKCRHIAAEKIMPINWTLTGSGIESVASSALSYLIHQKASKQTNPIGKVLLLVSFFFMDTEPKGSTLLTNVRTRTGIWDWLQHPGSDHFFSRCNPSSSPEPDNFLLMLLINCCTISIFYHIYIYIYEHLVNICWYGYRVQL